MNNVITRFAPSPTGNLHIGGVRTALYNYLIAKKYHGKFLLRIEDTDRERSKEEYVQDILQSLQWLNITWDQLVFQSQRSDLYINHLKILEEKGSVYKCFCEKDRLEALRKDQMEKKLPIKYDKKCLLNPAPNHGSFVYRLKNERHEKIIIKDNVLGEVTFDPKEFDDLIIRRSDGTFTYNYVVVIDDIDLKITHVIRGVDHLNNTAKQILLYEALGKSLPEFAHIPLIMGSDGKRLSKRHGAASLLEYKTAGFLPEALNNFLARIGWGYKDEEIFTLDELLQKFELNSINPSHGIFNYEKLLWLNGHYLSKKNPAEIISLIKEQLGVAIGDVPASLIELIKPRSKTLQELYDQLLFYVNDEITIQDDAKKMIPPEMIKPAQDLIEEFKANSEWNKQMLEQSFQKVITKHSLKLVQLAQFVRAAVTGKKASPGIFEIIEILGKDRTIRRIESATHFGME